MDPTADYDVARAGSGAAFGVVATGWLHYWWGFLEAFVGKRLPIAQRRLSNTLVKVFLDQAIGAPIYIYTYYVITNYIQELNALPSDSEQTPTKLLEETCERAAEMLPPTMLRHWTLWPLVHSLNFYYSPLHHRVLVQNLVLVGWSGCKCLYRRESQTFFSGSGNLTCFVLSLLMLCDSDLSHLNNGGLMTPKEEVEEVIAIKRRESNIPVKRKTHSRAEIDLKNIPVASVSEKL